MTNPYDAPQQTATKSKRRSFLWRPQSPKVFAAFFVLVFIGSLFIPTIEIIQNNVSWGHVPLWYAYLGLFDPQFWMITVPIVVAHVLGSYVLALVATALTERKGPVLGILAISLATLESLTSFVNHIRC